LDGIRSLTRDRAPNAALLDIEMPETDGRPRTCASPEHVLRDPRCPSARFETRWARKIGRM